MDWLLALRSGQRGCTRARVLAPLRRDRILGHDDLSLLPLLNTLQPRSNSTVLVADHG